MTDIKETLYAPLTVDSRRGRGGTYGYVKWQNVADRMNETFGMNWSSHVVYEDRLEDTIIVRVAVCAKDPVSGEQYCQEGYGASVLRSSDEPGSAHKGAYSKALKDACKKWGIGLHLEEGTPASNIPNGFTGHETAAPSAPPSAPPSVAPQTPAPQAPVAPPQAAPVAQTPMAPQNEAPSTPVAPAPVAPETPAPTTNMGLPPTPAPEGINQPVAPQVPQTPAPQAPAPTAPMGGMAPPAPAQEAANTSPDTPGTITSVQDMAIQNLSRLNGVEGQTITQFLQGLVDNPECELARPVTSLNELSYNEAVCVIKAAKSL